MVNTIFILDRAYNTTQILVGDKSSQRMFWNDLYTQEFDTGAETFEFSCYLNENVIEGNYVAFYYNNQYKLFTIMDMEQTHKQGKLVANCYCEIAGLSLLNNYVREFEGDMNCIQFFEYILNDTDWAIGKYSPSLEDTVKTIKVTKLESVWGLIEDYKDIFECELNIRATYENGHVTGKYIDIYSDGGLGSPTHKRFEYGRNVTGITKKKELYDWCTGLILDVDCDISEIIIRESDGLGFTKGAGDIILNDNANRMYNAGRNHVIGVYEGDETEPIEACINAWKELKERSTPRFDYEVTTALTEDEYEEVHLGDTVYVVDRSYTPPLFLEARVGKLELSFTDRTQNKCVLTNYKEIKSKLLDADYIKLTGTITDIVNAFFPITSEGIADGAIVDGKIETTYFQQITADIVSAGIGAFEDLYVKNMTVINADIENLRADTAEITQLKSQLAEIDTLINGHLTSDNIQSLILTSDKVTVADAFIKDAMIDTVNASKINTGVLNTNNVQIQSEDGSMLLQGNLQQFKDSSGKVRIQIGKDTNGEFTFCLFSQDGVGILLDENGLHSGAIGDGLIVDAMVSDNANIQGGKLDINSVITSINNGTTTINSNRIYLDEEGQSLKVAFDALKTKVETIEDVTIDGDLSSIVEQVTSNTTNINIMQGEISSLISNTTITKGNGEVVQLKDEYNSTKDTVDSHTTKIGSLETTVNSVSSKQASMELDLNGFRTEVSNSYATKEDINNRFASYTTKTEFQQSNEDFIFKIQQSGGGNLLKNTKFKDGSHYWNVWGLDDSNTAYRRIDIQEPWSDWNNEKERSLRVEVGVNDTSVGSSVKGGVVTEPIEVKTNTAYSFTCFVDSHRAEKINIEFYKSTDGKRFSYGGLVASVTPKWHSQWNTNYTEWNKIEATFTTGADMKYIDLRFWMDNYSGDTINTACCMWIALPCLVEGNTPMEWMPHESELYDGIVKINQDGLTVQHNSSKSVLDSEALKFYEGSTPYSRIESGQLMYTNGAGNNVGKMGRNHWKEDNNIWVSHIGAEYNCDITIGAKSSSNQDHFPTNFVIAGGNHDIGTTAVFYNGVNITYPTMASIVRFRPTTASHMDWDSTKEAYRGDGEIFAWRDSNSLKCLGVSGRNKLILGTHPSSTSKELFSIYTNPSGSNYIDAYAPLNMHGYSVANLTARNSLSARSTYSSTLMDSGTNEYLTHNSMSYGEGEVRWCWKETVFTYAECDVDPVTDEWIYTGRNICYIELPIFMAENIQNDYHINVSKMSWGDYRIIEKTPYYFILESREEDFAFTFEVVAKLIDGETTDNNAIIANEGMYEFSVEEEQEGARVYLDDIQENIITEEGEE